MIKVGQFSLQKKKNIFLFQVSKVNKNKYSNGDKNNNDNNNNKKDGNKNNKNKNNIKNYLNNVFGI